MKKQIIFHVTGGLGKNIAATAVVSLLKKTYPDHAFIVLPSWKEAWEHNPHVDMIIDIEKTPFLYRDYIKGTDSKIFRLDPYSADDFFHHRKHLVEIWCDLCGVPWHQPDADDYRTPGELGTPQLFFTEEEKEKVRKKLHADPHDKRPLFFIQPSGGAFNQPYPISWARDLPLKIAQEVVNEMNKRGYRTIHLRRENQIALDVAEWIPFTLREALCAIQFSDKRLFVDSFAAHAAAALNLPSVVTWVTNPPKVFGYPLHINIEAKEREEFRHLPDAYLEPYNISGVWSEHPYETDMIFSTEEILKHLK
jgi:ADP-heptose:LPS heptosyltransferase